ncbi:UNVERIFIED_ORG: crotonobetainyl-CoA:carnitine CoA-transferase CaiB-like acyl-CoA transferase [Nocardia globerula]|uniref:Crotonobetainyl-CoA:carnitine CoA-transferase CaiB-like acyl-CoA transferase n=1 Tax=Nocardia globerula TaxID=1818 RepID=A0A652YSP0_NOCGL|nr:CoA transferase [Rhodococcus globerulus]NMD61386.1 CoA transferase [Nocardia globerula]PVX67064.1 crotonobetainyl-CoA:carnitine CoA-transferase CaiB-like acyl-CoA transferase [Rhodococcus globerulus]
MTLPLAGIKVVEFSEHGFVPAASAAIADFGADVIKIERIEGDPMRALVPNGVLPQADGTDYMFQLVNRNKRGIALDVTTADGREIFERLIAWADVYITNQLPRVRRKLKTEPDDLFAINPTLVFAKGHGQGQLGPDSEAGGFDSVSYWSRGGVAQLLTPADAAEPVQQRPAIGDIPSGMHLAAGICAGLVHTLRTGKGVVVDTSLLNSAMWALGPDLAYASITGEKIELNSGAPRTPLMCTYRTSDGRFVVFTMLDEDRYWAPVCRALNLPELIDRYPDRDSRRPDWGSLTSQFKSAISDLDATDLQRALTEEGCIYSFYATPADVLADEAVAENGYLMDHPDHPTLRLPGPPAQFDNTPPAMRRPGPNLGEHTREILTELGYLADKIDRLCGEGVVLA